MKETLYISNFGLINALGQTKQSIMQQLVAGCQSGLSQRSDLLIDGEIVVADINNNLPSLSHKDAHLNTRNNQIALVAIEQIRTEVSELITLYGKQRIAVIMGTSTSGISEGEQAMAVHQKNNEFPQSYDYRQQEIYNLAEFVSDELSTAGVTMTISTACSSSAKAFKTASELIDSGLADAAIVGGVDTICGMTINGFHALDSTAREICQPSSLNRDGINIGEGAAIAVLRKDKGKVKLLGVGESSDAYHMSAPQPEGKGAIVAMKSALEQANYEPADVDYINLHGTATPKNDVMESFAIMDVFGSRTPCSSSKGVIGHTLGAAGATEIGLCWLLLNNKQNANRDYAPHVWDETTDPELAPLHLVAVGEQSRAPIKTCLSNSFAFGGNNVSVLIGL